jgi:transcription antitermination factor NusB
MAVKSRRKARETALSALYQIEVSQTPLDEALELAAEELELAADQRSYAERATRGVTDNISDIDNRVAKLVRGYDFDRIAVIDRNVLRIAAYELLFEPAIPPAVTINEAIEIAKRYSTAESGRFIHGVLSNLIKGTPKANWDPSTAPEEEISEPSAEPEEEMIDEETAKEAKAQKSFGPWTVRDKS